MIKKIYSVFDSATGVYSAPFLSVTQPEALRSWYKACQDDQLPFKSSPADFSLFELGSFDDSEGSFLCHKAPLNLGTALSALSRLNNGAEVSQ